jgi:hypothetical protein
MTGESARLRRASRSNAKRRVLAHLTTADASLALRFLPRPAASGIPAEASGCERRAGLSQSSKSTASAASLWSARLARPTSARTSGLPRISALSRRLGPDAAHTPPRPAVDGWNAACMARVPAIINTVDGLYDRPGDPTGQAGGRLRTGLGSRLPLPRRAPAEPEYRPVLRMLGVPAGHLHLLGNGVDLTRSNPDRYAESVLAYTRSTGSPRTNSPPRP